MKFNTHNLLQLCAIAGFAILAGSTTYAADHLDSPSVGDDGRLDINDLYAFQSPANASNTVLIMTVNPLAGVLSDTTFNSRGTYEFHVDNNGDAVSDLTFNVYFSRPRRGSQNILLLREDGSIAASGKTGQTISVAGGGQLRADLFEDPFFFDLNGFNDGFNFTGDDFFEGQNVTAIVLEIPSSSLNGPNIAVSARTTVGGTQFDRMGRPAINTALIPSARKDEFNASAPVNDFANFGADMQATIEALNGGDSATAAGLTAILLPDLLTFDVTDASGFLNGRGLADDVIDAELGLLTNNAVTGDGVDSNDATFLSVFPYVAAPN
ncbi:DUF4331 family protein [Fuerstiella marisgermanici]|uniref:DUF4331 domain-containing protein n=1 Tax=Fuerstiella marisgermanici TaxID=1891926 RepID=A0A1P8WKT7_9PLAN|nr:DUF4331 family protein [Fuerstiella marisgermanici]APZ94684.1 hypothetical protein Fuma_04323 [Fuerstiella marisgermanici]